MAGTIAVRAFALEAAAPCRTIAFPVDDPDASSSLKTSRFPSALAARSTTMKVADALCAELQARVNLAGVKVEEAKLTHLAYAPEIAGAMLRRQQAEAVISAWTTSAAPRWCPT